MPFHLPQALEVLQRTPATLHAMLSGLSSFWTHSNYGENTFSPFDVIGHLIEGERHNWLPRARLILEQSDKPFPPFDRYAMYETSKGRTLSELLDEFTTLRAHNLRQLDSLNLTPDRLAFRGIHPDFGPVTLQQLLATWVVHDLGHTHQIAKAMAYQYRDEVGPWRKFLTILPQH